MARAKGGSSKGASALRAALDLARADLDEAKAVSRAKSAFLATVSHELRTPLNGIIGFAEMIAREQWGPIADKRYPAYANDIVTSARRLLHVLSDILDMARLESGRAEVIRDTLSLSDVVEEALVLVKERAPPGDHAPVEVAIASEFPVLWTDRRHLRQIIVNLLANALAFTDKNGRVRLAGRIGAGGALEIEIADSGIGMTPEEMKRAVTRFGQAEDGLARKHAGIGLGLPLAKSLTELLGGAMTITSARGQGTTVVLSFPTERMREAPVVWAKPPDRMAERAKRIAAVGKA